MIPNSRSLLVLTALILFVTSATGSVLSIGNCEVTAGSTASVDIVLDEAPGGLSGYSINVTIEDPSVAAVSAVSFPSWASLHESSSLPSGDCKVWSLDLYEQVQSGATEITLATMAIQGLSTGTTAIALNVSMMSDDTDGNISPLLLPGVFTVAEPSGGSVMVYEPEKYNPGPSQAPSFATTMATVTPTTQVTSGSSGSQGGASTVSVEKTATTMSFPTVSPEGTGEQMRAETPAATEDIPDALPITEPPQGFPPPLTSPLLIAGMTIPVIAALVVLVLAVRGKL